MPSFIRKPTAGEIIAAIIGAAVAAAFFNKDSIMAALPLPGCKDPETSVSDDGVIDVTPQQ